MNNTPNNKPMNEKARKAQLAAKRSPGMGPGAPSLEKPENFAKTIARLIKSIYGVRPVLCFIMIICLIAGSAGAGFAPKALGEATNVLFEGLISKEVTKTIDCTLSANVSIDSIKSKISDDEGHLSFEKLEALQSQPTASSANTTNAASAVNSSKSAGTITVKPGCATQEKSEDEFSKPANMDSLKDMLSSMKITIGGGVDWSAFNVALMLVILVYLISLVFRWIGGWISVQLIARGTYNLRKEVERKIWRVPLSSFDKMSRGEIMSRMTNDLDNIQQTITQTGGDLIYLSLMVIFVLIMMFVTSWLLALIALISLPLSMLIVGFIMKNAAPAFKNQWAKTGELNSTVEESITGHILVKTYGKTEKIAADFEAQNDALFKAAFKAQFISGLLMPIMTFLTNINYVLIALVGGINILNGTLSLGAVQASIQYSRQYSQPITQISQMINMLQSGAASGERIFQILDLPEEEDESTANPKFNNDRAQNYIIESGEIRFENVDFSYTQDHELIKNMNLVAKPGESVAIVGETGAGKTTLVNLIMRFYDVNSGKIIVDGMDARDISRRALRRNISMVLQDSWLFKGTIRENLLYGVPEGQSITEEEFEQACRATYVDHFVKALPQGYNTILDEDGSELSNGERQLLTIARAFLSGANILILDEATSSVDTRTEVLVQKAMNKLRSGRTSFVIAHRLSTIRDADQIIVMSKGSIVEQGNHNELISQGGHYAKLYQSQFETVDDNEADNVSALA